MKIAIINYNFTGTTIALAKAFLDKGHQVDLYCGMYLSQHNEMEALKIKKNPRIPGIWKIDLNNCIGLNQCKNINFKFYILSTITSGFNTHNIFRKILFFISKLQVRIYCQTLLRKKYNYVCVIGQDPISLFYNFYIGKKIFNTHTFHEITTNHLTNNKQLLPALSQVASKHINIIVHSKYNKNIIMENSDIPNNLIHAIPFGEYTSYKEFNTTVKIRELNGVENFILFIGYITPYKGLSILYNAIQNIDNRLSPNIKVVIAGKGNDPILEKMKNNTRYILINKWLTNNEITTLIVNAKVIVCPYLSASQSGIPQTAFVFNKPIIATNVGAFNEIIENNSNGWLIPKGDFNTLSDVILQIYNNNLIYSKLTDNIKNNNYKGGVFKWENIIEKYIDLIKQTHEHTC